MQGWFPRVELAFLIAAEIRCDCFEEANSFADGWLHKRPHTEGNAHEQSVNSIWHSTTSVPLNKLSLHF